MAVRGHPPNPPTHPPNPPNHPPTHPTRHKSHRAPQEFAPFFAHVVDDDGVLGFFRRHGRRRLPPQLPQRALQLSRSRRG